MLRHWIDSIDKSLRIFLGLNKQLQYNITNALVHMILSLLGFNLLLGDKLNGWKLGKISIFIRGGIHLQHLKVTTCYNIWFCDFQSLNSRSKPFNMISILKCALRPNFTFFWIFLLFIKYFTKLLFLDNFEQLKYSS